MPISTTHIAFIGSIIILLLACHQTKVAEHRFVQKEAPQCGIDFKNTITEDAHYNMIDYSYCYNGGGVGGADLDNDGLIDLVFTGNQTSCKVYKNLGNWTFKDQTTSAGLQTQGWCSGVTFADVNVDGWMDIYISRAGNESADLRANLLFINEKGFKFSEKAQEYGLADTSWTTQAAFFDYDLDGDLDCYLVNHTNDDRYPNRIKDRTIDFSKSSACDRLYQNDKGHFKDISAQAGIADDGWGLGVAVADFNSDHWPDLYISNDFLVNDLLYINQQNGTFKESARASLDHTSHFSMGNDAADFNNDGLTDLMVADMMPATHQQRKKMTGVLTNDAYDLVLERGYAPQYMRNTLQLNLGTKPNPTNSPTLPHFSEIGQLAGVHATDWSWSPLFADFDLDGYQDLAISSGYRHNISDMDFIIENSQLGSKMPLAEADIKIKERAKLQADYASDMCFFRNNGDLTFADSTHQWSPAMKGFHHGSITADLDNDGDLDLVCNRLDDLPLILENQRSNNNQWLQVRVQYEKNNPTGLGTTIKLYQNNTIQTRYLMSTRGYQSGTDALSCFGLGTNTVDSIWVCWPNGQHQKYSNAGANQLITLKYDLKKCIPSLPNTQATTLLYQLQQTITPTRTQEPVYADFAAEPLIPHKFSNESQRMCNGDLNGDGLMDFYLGGGARQTGVFFIQEANGNFKQQPLIAPELQVMDFKAAASPYSYAPEDIGSTLFDADGDRDLDLYLVSGSNEFEPKSIYLQDRLYLNDGRGGFSPAPEGALPQESVPGSCVVHADYDLDGDMDLFVGGRRQALKYGLPGESFLLQNNGKGQFIDVTNTAAPGLKSCGMVTCAQWTDLNNDQVPELVVGGELMPLSIWYFKDGKYAPTEIPQTHGLWRCMLATDVNHDGRTDLVAGNIGLNHYLNIQTATPFCVYATDMDANGYFDPISTYYVDKKEVTLLGREAISRQVPILRKKYTTFAAFADATFPDMFNQQTIEAASLSKATEPRSVWLEQMENGAFTMHPLPIMAQIAPMNAISEQNYDKSGKNSLFMVFNDFGWEVGIGRMDAGVPLMLRYQATDFEVMPPNQTGLWAKGELRSIQAIDHQLFISTGEGNLMIYKKTNK